MKKHFIIILPLSLLIVYSERLVSAPIEDREAYALYLENDSKNLGGPGSDEAYTNGIKLSYIYSQGDFPRWARSFLSPFHWFSDSSKGNQINFGISIGHHIFTPSNIQTSKLVIHDRPYASWLYLGFAVSLRESQIEHFAEIDIGTIGPSSLGEEVQNNFHRLISERTAEGWGNSVRDEPTLQIFYQRRYKRDLAKSVDVLPYWGTGVGNVFLGGHFGSLLRVGPRLPEDFGPSRPSASDGNSFISVKAAPNSSTPLYYGFAGLRTNIVGRNIFLDGNSYQSSHRIQKNSLTYETEMGLGIHFTKGVMSWRLVTRSPEFQQKNESTTFASISFVYIP